MTEHDAPGAVPPEPAPAAPPAAPLAAPPATTDFADGEWHRLHPATPLFRGGLAFIAIIGVLIVNLRDRLFEIFFDGQDVDLPPTGGDLESDAIDFIVREELVLVALLVAVGVLLLLIAGFYFSWRLHTFRITDEVVEVRSGILFRTNRKARLDRIQGINIGRPFVPRLFGAAKLEISVAGNDASVPLAYLRGRDADALRRDILLLASGAQRSAAPDASPDGAASGMGGMLDQRVSELLAPELDVELAQPESIVRMNPGRLIGSTVLSDTTLVLVVMLIGLGVTIALSGELFLLFAMLPGLIGIGGFLVARITRSLRYSIAATPDGVRVGFGLLSTTNETLPPGRIHSVKVSQPLLWRPAGWWQIAVNRASRSSQNGAAGQQQTTILPVGNLDDVRAVLRLLLPEVAVEAALPVLELGLSGRGDEGGFTVSPRRARVLRWFSQPRNGFALTDAAVLLRKGAIWRSLTIVPLSRTQSVAVRQGPVLRALRLGEVHVHTVAGPIIPTLGALDRTDAMRLFDDVAAASLVAARTDTSHRWRQR
ncbi:PH domain-containing protein [Microcella sp.]|uniref:PH domain-containing protein n=1 Tax=Microcella sp. TaxID=1913979 RepID=UPI003F7135F9